MIIKQFDFEGVFAFKAEDDAPVGLNRDGPKSLQIALQRMPAISGQVKGLRRIGGVKNGENSFDSIQQIGANPASVAAFVKAFKASTLEVPNHET
jgi:hypothetical protein